MWCRDLIPEVRKCFLLEDAIGLTLLNLVTKYSKTGVATVYAGSSIAGKHQSQRHKVQRINIYLGYLDGAAANAQFNNPFGMCLDQFGTLY